MVDKKKIPDYYTIIPESLWHEADELVDYVEFYPFLQPTHCKHCGSSNITLGGVSRPNSNGLQLYRCKTCRRRFNQVTNTRFMRMQNLALWGDFARLRLAGKSTNQISSSLGLATNPCNYRTKVLEKIMAEHWPNLYQWWKPHQDYLDHQFSPQVEQEYNYFIDWLKQVMKKPQTSCPHCGNPNAKRKQSHRPLFYCGPCDKVFSLLGSSPLKKLLYPERWIPYAKALIKGQSNISIARKFKVEEQVSANWKRKFIQQMQLLNLHELVHWITWRHSRGNAYTSKVTREQNKQPKKRIKNTHSQ